MLFVFVHELEPTILCMLQRGMGHKATNIVKRCCPWMTNHVVRYELVHGEVLLRNLLGLLPPRGHRTLVYVIRRKHQQKSER